MNIALTGGIGSGKSCVAQIFANAMDSPAVNVDLISRDLMEQGAEGWLGVCERWQGRFLCPDGTIDRPLLREAVFGDAMLRHELEDLLHPLIRFAVEQRMQAAERSGESLIVEVPLLFEVGWQDDFACTVAVFAPASLCLQRICRRDGIGFELAMQILAAQMPPQIKAAKAMFVIDNSGLWVQTVQQVARLASQLRVSSARQKNQGPSTGCDNTCY